MVAGSGYDACRQTLAGKIGDTRWLLVQQLGQGTPKAFLALLNLVADLTVRQFWSVRAA